MNPTLRVIRDHAQALLKLLRGRPESRHAEGIVKALDKMQGESTSTR